MSINFEQILRYAISGGFGIIAFLASFSIPIDSEGRFGGLPIGAWELAALALIAGSIVYAAYRAIIFPIFHLMAMNWSGRGTDMVSADVARWTRLKNASSPQSYLSEWGSQIHLLNTCGVSGLFFLGWGIVTDQNERSSYAFVFFIILSTALLVFGFVSTLRYQFREKLIEESENRNSSPQSLASAKIVETS